VCFSQLDFTAKNQKSSLEKVSSMFSTSVQVKQVLGFPDPK